MKQKNKIILILLVWIGFSLSAQESLDSLLSKVEQNNPVLINAGHLLEARKLEASTGLTPPNPEVEYGYMWGTPDVIGNRTDFAVSQSFDFPTVYSSQNKLSDITKEQAQLQFEATRQEVILKARQAWILQVHLNKVRSILERRLSYAETVLQSYERKLETGESNQLQLNQSRMKVVALKNEISRLEQRFTENNARLMNLTGNIPVTINDTVWPLQMALNPDTLLSDYESGYLNQIYQTEVDRKSKEVDVVFNKKLPKLSAGYYSESVVGEKFQGVQAGISIPLWENARAVKTAKAKVIYAQSDAERFWQEKENEIRQKYDQLLMLQDRVKDMEQVLSESNDEALLRQAMEAGEITLTDYYYESDFYYQTLVSLLEFRKDLLLLEAELRKVYY
ncbi:MAG TPA: TolC family protein [Bacteroidales bacterium]|nr:TolC family protein [Bacteroidales bacterium]HPE56658.1 TolC family protein [Bacteroidales bacterium]HRX97201.1 TolC family protein [Bacteroidales bacterium]